jgi:hypothetical protein
VTYWPWQNGLFWLLGRRGISFSDESPRRVTGRRIDAKTRHRVVAQDNQELRRRGEGARGISDSASLGQPVIALMGSASESVKDGDKGF